jgi:N-methylhydantoinase A
MVKARRPVRLAGAVRETAIVDRDTLGPGAVLDGPAIVEEAHSTLLIPPGWRLTVHVSGALIAEGGAA